jgi:hypothetical protein
MTKEPVSKGMPSEVDKGYGVYLPCGREEMSSFLSSLFGNSQKISNVFYGRFEVTHEEVVGFHYLLEQRLGQNHNSYIASVMIKIVYDDNSAVTFNSIEDFRTYNEVSPLISVAVHLTWVIFMQFPGSSLPEKQSIDLSIVANKDNENPLFDVEDMFRLKTYLSDGCIYYSISHTMRSWGADIQSLLKNHISTVMEKESFFREYIRNKADMFSVLVAICLLALPVVVLIHYYYQYSGERKAMVDYFLKEAGQNIDVKINYLISIVSDGFWGRYMFFGIVSMLLALVLSVAAGAMMDYILEKRPPSFILLTSKSKSEKDRFKSRILYKKLGFGFTILCSFIINVMSTICYDKFIK